MKRRYKPAQVIAHGLLYPLKFLPEGAAKRALRVRVLRYRNSVPLYLVLQRGDTAVQVGTPNVVTVRRFSRLVGAEGRVVVVEADPDNAGRLAAALPSLPHANVIVVNKGAWSAAGSLRLQRSATFDGDHRFDVDGTTMDNDFRGELRDSVEVSVDTLDDMLADAGVDSIDYLSITVNGAELEVLKGSRTILQASPGARVYSKGHARLGGPDSTEALNGPVARYLSECGFRTVVSRGERSTSGRDDWQHRDGDVFGWRDPNAATP